MTRPAITLTLPLALKLTLTLTHLCPLVTTKHLTLTLTRTPDELYHEAYLKPKP